MSEIKNLNNAETSIEQEQAIADYRESCSCAFASSSEKLQSFSSESEYEECKAMLIQALDMAMRFSSSLDADCLQCLSSLHETFAQGIKNAKDADSILAMALQYRQLLFAFDAFGIQALKEPDNLALMQAYIIKSAEVSSILRESLSLDEQVDEDPSIQEKSSKAFEDFNAALEEEMALYEKVVAAFHWPEEALTLHSPTEGGIPDAK